MIEFLSALYLLSIIIIVVNFRDIKPMERTESINIQYSKLNEKIYCETDDVKTTIQILFNTAIESKVYW